MSTRQPLDEAGRIFGQHIKSCRRARGLTQEQLAERAGLSADTIRRLEHGSFSPSLVTLRKLCSGMQLYLSTLFAGYELGERMPSREFCDAFEFLTPEEQTALLMLVMALRRSRSGTS